MNTQIDDCTLPYGKVTVSPKSSGRYYKLDLSLFTIKMKGKGQYGSFALVTDQDKPIYIHSRNAGLNQPKWEVK